MNLFRSEEHIRNLPHFDPSTEDGILALDDLVGMFSSDFCRKRLEPDYVSNSRKYIEEFLSGAAELGKTKPFWRPE